MFSFCVFDEFFLLQLLMAKIALDGLKERTIHLVVFQLRLEEILVLAKCTHELHFIDDFRVGTRIVFKRITPAKWAFIFYGLFGAACTGKAKQLLAFIVLTYDSVQSILTTDLTRNMFLC